MVAPTQIVTLSWNMSRSKLCFCNFRATQPPGKYFAVEDADKQPSDGQKLPPIEILILKQDVTEKEWKCFTQEFKRLKRCVAIPSGQEANVLFSCCVRSLGRLLLKEDAGIIEAGKEKLLEAMKKMADIRVAVSIRRTQLMSMKQEPGQSIREFYANANAQAFT